MPTTSEKNLDLDRPIGPDCMAAGAEPAGEATAAPPGMLGRLGDKMRDKLPDELVDELLAEAKMEEEIGARGRPLSKLTTRLVDLAMKVELTEHLGYEPHREPPGG